MKKVCWVVSSYRINLVGYPAIIMNKYNPVT